MAIVSGSALMNLGGVATDNDNGGSVGSITLFVGLLCICILLGHLLKRSRWINESVVALVIGLGTGVIILLATKGVSSRLLEFNGELFFIYLLPPIIFNAGFQVKKKQFFRNFMTIMLFGAIGTMISFCIIAFGSKMLLDKLGMGNLELRDYLAIGAIFSATDSVCTLQVLNQDETPLLYSLVFGEGVVNDAASVVLFNAIQKFDPSDFDSSIAQKFIGNFMTLFITSTLLGVVIGLISAYIIKKLYTGRNSTDREVSLMILMAYLSYIMAELFDLSGILTVFFCGIVMSHYTWHNVTPKSRVTTKHMFATLSFIAETFIFLYVGMDALDAEKWEYAMDSPEKSVGASAVILGLILVGRAAFVFPISFLFNLAKKSNSDKLGLKHQVTIWWAGLMRGAVSLALAYNQFAKFGHTKQPGNAMMISCTISVVLFSTVVFGLLTKHLVRFLFAQPNHLNEDISFEPLNPSSMVLPLLCRNVTAPLSVKTSCVPISGVHFSWRKFDNAFMRPVFGGKRLEPDVEVEEEEEEEED